MARRFIFCPEKGVSVGMDYETEEGSDKVTLAVTFCQEHVPFNRNEARKHLEERLNDAEFIRKPKEGDWHRREFRKLMASNPYVAQISYKGESPHREILIPFFRYVLALQATSKNHIKHLMKNSAPKAQKKEKWYMNRITSFSELPVGTTVSVNGENNSLADAQAASLIKTATTYLHRFGQIIWPENSPNAFFKTQKGYEKLSERICNRIKYLEDWRPLFLPAPEPRVVIKPIEKVTEPVTEKAATNL